MSIEAMKQALELLRKKEWEACDYTSNASEAADILEKAIAEAEKQESVAWIDDIKKESHKRFKLPTSQAAFQAGALLARQYVYTTPQQRKPLSAYINSAKINATDLPHIVVEKLEKAIEAAHGIKGEA